MPSIDSNPGKPPEINENLEEEEEEKNVRARVFLVSKR
jgi:hypothetical protein